MELIPFNHIEQGPDESQRKIVPFNDILEISQSTIESDPDDVFKVDHNLNDSLEKIVSFDVVLEVPQFICDTEEFADASFDDILEITQSSDDLLSDDDEIYRKMTVESFDDIFNVDSKLDNLLENNVSFDDVLELSQSTSDEVLEITQPFDEFPSEDDEAEGKMIVESIKDLGDIDLL